MSDHYDVIIVGSGGTLAHTLAPSGKRILILDHAGLADHHVHPSIGAVNPALTAMANAIRVREHLLTRLTTAR